MRTDVLLRHPTRAAIVGLLDERPGRNQRQIARATGISPELARFHLERLDRANLIVVRDSPRRNEHLCFNADDADLWEDERTRILYGHSTTAVVAGFVARAEKSATDEIGGAVGLSPSTVRYHLRKLRARELIDRLQLGRGVTYIPTERLTRWWDRVSEAGGRPPSQAGHQ